jgi:transposase
MDNFIIFIIFICRLKLKVKRLKMALTLDERVEIVLLSGRQGLTKRQVADEFHARHPERNPIPHSAVGKLVKKFKETGSVLDKPRIGRPSIGEDIQTGVIAKFHAHSHWFQTFRIFCILGTLSFISSLWHTKLLLFLIMLLLEDQKRNCASNFYYRDIRLISQ